MKALMFKVIKKQTFIFEESTLNKHIYNSKTDSTNQIISYHIVDNLIRNVT